MFRSSLPISGLRMFPPSGTLFLRILKGSRRGYIFLSLIDLHQANTIFRLTMRNLLLVSCQTLALVSLTFCRPYSLSNILYFLKLLNSIKLTLYKIFDFFRPSVLNSSDFWTDEVNEGLKKAYADSNQVNVYCVGRGAAPLPVIARLITLLP